MTYRTIVVGTDGSPTATVAAEVAQALAKRFKGRLVLVGASTRTGSPAGADRPDRSGRGRARARRSTRPPS